MARINSLVTFIDGGVPGDVADIQVYGLKKNFAEARIVKLRQSSPDRLEPFCSHFGTCGGCKWQHMTYERQLYYKQKHVSESLSRIGKSNKHALLESSSCDLPKCRGFCSHARLWEGVPEEMPACSISGEGYVTTLKDEFEGNDDGLDSPASRKDRVGSNALEFPRGR